MAAVFQSSCSFLWVPESSPRLTNVAWLCLMASKASCPPPMPLTPAGSVAGPTITKSLYITYWRLMADPFSTSFISAAGECTKSTSASPFSPNASACPVPTAIVLTSYPILLWNRGTSTSKRPVSAVLVVVARMIGSLGWHAVVNRTRASTTVSANNWVLFTANTPLLGTYVLFSSLLWVSSHRAAVARIQ